MAALALQEKETLLRTLDLGSTVAEQDAFLFDARIETAAFDGLMLDRIDLVPGTKGSGKTALFRLIAELLRSYLLKEKKTIILTGVEATGDPVFRAFVDKLRMLDETQFENFWRVYLVALVLENFINNPANKAAVNKAKKQKERFVDSCRAAHIPQLKKTRTLREIMEWALNAIERIRLFNADVSEEGYQYSLIDVEPAKSGVKAEKAAEAAPVFLNDIHSALVDLLKAMDLKLWILLDRLDEVFPRRSDVERTALRALLKTMRNFPTPVVRVKVFLRDDIFETLLKGKEGFTALSHLQARKASTLQWSKDEIQHLVLKRIALNERAKKHYVIDAQMLDQDAKYRQELFRRIFPCQVMPGPRQSKTLDWIYNHCQDGRGTVTPRDVLDLLKYAVEAELYHLLRKETDTENLVSAQSLREALVKLSKQKREVYLSAEFPHFWPDIQKFEGQKAEHNEGSLKKILGVGWKEKAEDLISIGFLRRLTRHTYVVPFVFRAGMGMPQGKAF